MHAFIFALISFPQLQYHVHKDVRSDKIHGTNGYLSTLQKGKPPAFRSSRLSTMSLFSKLLECCCFPASPQSFHLEKCHFTDPNYAPYRDKRSQAEVADNIVVKLFAAEDIDTLQADLESTIHASGWYNGLAAAVLAALEKAIESQTRMGSAVKAAYDKAVTALHHVMEWTNAHPKLTAVALTLVALGVLALMTPWLMGYLGFAEEGILEGESLRSCNGCSDPLIVSWAAGWQATYRGFVPKGSLFSYLQSLGTKIGRNWSG